MNASAPSLSREGEVQSEIRKVRTFGRTARVVCAIAFGFGLVGSAFTVIMALIGAPPPEGASAFTDQQKLWGLPIMAVVTATWLAAAYHLYRLFGNLAAGSIYTPENVRRVRHIGLLQLLMAVLGVAIPVVAHALATTGFTVPVQIAFAFQSSELGTFVSAGLILLVSWIMDVGLHTKDHADALQRDADLVI